MLNGTFHCACDSGFSGRRCENGMAFLAIKRVKVSGVIKHVKVSEAISQTSLLKCANKVF